MIYNSFCLHIAQEGVGMGPSHHVYKLLAIEENDFNKTCSEKVEYLFLFLSIPWKIIGKRVIESFR